MSVIHLSPFHRPELRVGHPVSVCSSTRRGGPAYDIEKTGEQAYRVTVAVPGFRPDDLTVTARADELVVTGKHAEKFGGHVGHGVVSQSFERRFDLDEHVEVVGASLANGLLTIDLQQRLPTAAKSRTIEIKSRSPKPTLAGQARQAAASVRDAVARWFARSRSLRPTAISGR